MKTSLRTALLLSVLTVIFGLSVSAQVIDKPNEDPGAGLAADFAIKEQASRAKTTVDLTSIVKATDKAVKIGTRHLTLCLDTKIKGKQTYVQAVVTMDMYSNQKLVSWAKSSCAKGAAGASIGGYKPLDKGHAGAGLAADFAVKERAAALKKPVQLVSIVKAEMDEGNGARLGAGTFRLCLVTTGGSVGPGSQAVVSMDQYSNLKLISWVDSRCAETDGEYEPVEKDFTAGVDLAADWAVGKHSKDTGIEHKLVEILKREEKGMFGVTYRICMKVSEEGKTQTIQAIVSRDQYSNHKLVSWEHSKCTK